MAAVSTVLATYQPFHIHIKLSVQTSCFGGLIYAYNRFLSLMNKAENRAVGGRKAHGFSDRGVPSYLGSW